MIMWLSYNDEGDDDHDKVDNDEDDINNPEDDDHDDDNVAQLEKFKRKMNNVVRMQVFQPSQ
jgi:hypothetical protein